MQKIEFNYIKKIFPFIIISKFILNNFGAWKICTDSRNAKKRDNCFYICCSTYFVDGIYTEVKYKLFKMVRTCLVLQLYE